MAPKDAAPPDTQEDREAAGGRLVGMRYADLAPQLLENGYAPLPLLPGSKRPALARWSRVPIDAATLARWSRSHGDCGVGLRTGTLVGIDIDILDLDLAHQVHRLVTTRLGATLMRVGQWPKRLLLYRTQAPFAKLAVPGVEVQGAGQQVVAFGIHPVTQQPYHWPLGETPLDMACAELPQVDADACEALLAEVAALVPPTGGFRPRVQQQARENGGHPVRDAEGRVIDGRDGWLSTISYHVVQDALAAGEALDARRHAAVAWARFEASTGLARPRQGGARPWGPADALGKIEEKLRLHREGRLPTRSAVEVEAAYQAPTLSADAARTQLDAELEEACRHIEAWHLADDAGPCPRIGISATVGLGKSVRARHHLLALSERLAEAGKPSRLLVFVPSHRLAEEAASGWREAGRRVAVLRGYEAIDPVSGEPVCRDLDAVQIALTAGFEVQTAACAAQEQRCRFFAGCPKQRNRREVEAAEVVIAPYDALFSGLAMPTGSIGAILIDEGCWARAIANTIVPVATFLEDLAGWLRRSGNPTTSVAASADLLALREKAADAFQVTGVVTRQAVRATGLSASDCRDAARLELDRIGSPGLHPGIADDAREPLRRQVMDLARARAHATLWRALRDLLETKADGDGRVRVISHAGQLAVEVLGSKPIHSNLAEKPVLHLDATLRPDLARAVLPNLECLTIEASTPHMQVALVQGRFGKGTICPAAGLAHEEAARRANRLRECVDYVHWQARRVSPGRVLVVTHKSIEAAFAGIPGVATEHFNAVAGLDVHRDVRLLIVLGRPLPSQQALGSLAGGILGHSLAGEYRRFPRGVRMHDGTSRSVQVVEHSDPQGEVLRGAICDDELIQAIGRGRGVNRTAANPLEVHLLADVALPLVHDRVLAWETVVPDVFQRMLLAGMAVDSPADAVALYPGLFTNEKQAQKKFERAGFKRQIPLRDIYREMSLKSAAYRRPGRGRSWQHCWWLDASSDAARDTLARVLGPLAAWSPVAD